MSIDDGLFCPVIDAQVPLDRPPFMKAASFTFRILKLGYFILFPYTTLFRSSVSRSTLRDVLGCLSAIQCRRRPCACEPTSTDTRSGTVAQATRLARLAVGRIEQRRRDGPGTAHRLAPTADRRRRQEPARSPGRGAQGPGRHAGK